MANNQFRPLAAEQRGDIKFVTCVLLGMIFQEIKKQKENDNG